MNVNNKNEIPKADGFYFIAAAQHFRIVFVPLFSKRGLVQNLSYENEFYLHVNETSFSYRRLCSKTRFETQVQGNSEMAYFSIFQLCPLDFIYTFGGGTGAGDREKRGWEGTVRERRGGEKRDSQGGGKREKKGKITQRCAIFCNRKNSKRREPTNTERDPGLQEAGSLNLPVPPPPPPTIQTRSQVLDALISPYGKDLMGLHSLKELDSRFSLFLFFSFC